MDIIRRNTDYALRLGLNLAQRYGQKAVSARILSDEEKVSYQITCKLLQKLHQSGLVGSQMGPQGGYFLAHPPNETTLSSIVQAIQGPLSINRCLFEKKICPKQPDCPISKKLAELQDSVESFLNNTALGDLY